MRICSLVPSATEMLFALGLGDEVVGVSHECDFPPEAARKTRLMRTIVDQERLSSAEIDRLVRETLRRRASLYEIDAGRLAAARPELIVAQALCEVCAVDANQAAAAARQLIPAPRLLALHPHRLDDILEDIRLLGEATGRAAEADALIAAARARLARVRSLIPRGAPKPRVCCVEWLEPLMPCGHWVPEQVAAAGGEEVLGCAGEPSRVIDPAALVAARPDVLILMPCGFSIERTARELPCLQQAPWWAQLPAVRERRVFLVNGPAYFNRSGPRVIEGVELLARLLHGVDIGPSSPADARAL